MDDVRNESGALTAALLLGYDAFSRQSWDEVASQMMVLSL